MRIEITAGPRTRKIDTYEPENAARWLLEQIPLLLKVNAAMPPAYIEIWPETKAEESAGLRVAQKELARAGLLELAEAILKSLPEKGE